MPAEQAGDSLLVRRDILRENSSVLCLSTAAAVL